MCTSNPGEISLGSGVQISVQLCPRVELELSRWGHEVRTGLPGGSVYGGKTTQEQKDL